MAAQGMFFRACNTIGSTRLLLNNRVIQINSQSVAFKQSISDKLKELNLPEKPKKPSTSYFRYLRDHRAELIKQHPDWKNTQITKQCALDWKNVDLDIKNKYRDEFLAEQEKFAKKFIEYTEKLTEDQKQALQQIEVEIKDGKQKRDYKKKLRENHKPKRPVGAYILYVMELAKTQGKPFIECLKNSKGHWGTLPEVEKAKYVATAENLKKIYDKEMEVWELKMMAEGKNELVRRDSVVLRRASKSRKRTGGSSE